MAPASVRLIATWRFSGPTRSLVRLSAIGNTPPAPIPASMRVANSSRERGRECAQDVGKAEQRSRQPIISRVLPNRSAAAPMSGWMIEKVKANTAAKPAAVAMLTPKSSATCGSTGSSARAESAAAKLAPRYDVDALPASR